MADIKIQYLSIYNVSGIDLFSDMESFMKELNNQDELDVLGGQKCDATCRGASCTLHSYDCFGVTHKIDK
jgi:hypothetical protein